MSIVGDGCYGGGLVRDRLADEIRQQQCVIVVGETGSGKTTRKSLRVSNRVGRHEVLTRHRV
jgi:ABC-type proline/glycine betaine transport system ATPase subunit